MIRDFVYSLLMVQTSYRQSIQRKIKEKGIDLTFEMLQVMNCLYRKDEINQQEIADQIYKDKSSMSYLINNLEKRNLVCRITDANDKRNKLILLTQEGRALHSRVIEVIDEVYSVFEKNIDEKDIANCITYLHQINDVIKKESK